MIKKPFLISFMFLSILSFCEAQEFFKTTDLFRKPDSEKSSGSLNIIQDLSVDTLISRYVLYNKKLNGLEGFRIQIYRSSNKNARDEANKENAEFMIEYPDIPSIVKFAEPGYFLVRAGNYRTKVEATKQLLLVRKKFPRSYLVPDIINFPDQIKN
jgi:hypothetical protein